ncbi:MAG: bifunctional 4-hydroxy-2-oxoglutarate aldolase/2-dehydro-3-deoxy-phosphogluconate aldolase [Atopobiaceae bacterium]|nr:bifunctional 4-hydroxy-2-oxoglutarate aldolase/2-dehydro-3-deoxy-phosphogluconate aldolase [Atopobiaceae bacterium]
MYMDDFYAKAEKIGVIPVVVLDDAFDAEPLADALVAGGLPAAEVTFRTDAAADSIRTMCAAHPEMCVGAGTVLTVEQVDDAVAAGAEFIVSPGFDAEVVQHCIDIQVPVMPACVTPTEIIQALKLGLHVTKFFPAAQYGGLATIKSLSAPFVGHRFMPTGGVNLDNLADYLACPNIIAVGGTWMVKADLIHNGENDKIEQMCREAADTVKRIRG